MRDLYKAIAMLLRFEIAIVYFKLKPSDFSNEIAPHFLRSSAVLHLF